MRTLIGLGSCIVFALGMAARGAANDPPLPRPKPVVEAALHNPTAAVAPPIVATGLPVPRWVSVKAERVNVRRGPSTEHEVLWTYVKSGVPVEIIAEYASWRRIRDADGSTGWVKTAMLGGERTVMTTGGVNTAILAEPKAEAEAVAIAEPGLVAKLVSCEGEWCEISTRGYDGYVTRDRLWGVYESETVK